MRDGIAERLKALADLGGMSTEDVRVLREASKLLAEREGRDWLQDAGSDIRAVDHPPSPDTLSDIGRKK
jgi:hypothetical protein